MLYNSKTRERNKTKMTKGKFLQQDTNKNPNLKKVWRKPRGRHSKLRLNKKGHLKRPSPGFGSPRSRKYMHPSGLMSVLVNNLTDLENAKGKGVLISGTMGMKKKLSLLERAQSMGLKVLNIKNVQEFIKESKDNLNKRKEERNKKLTVKKKSKEESVKKAETKKESKKEEAEKETKEKINPIVKETLEKDVPKKETKTVHRPSAPQQK